MNEEWWRMMKNDEEWWRMMKDDEGWMMNDEGWWFQAVEGFCFLTDRQTDWWMNKQTDIGECRVAFATEKFSLRKFNIFKASHGPYIVDP